MRQCRKADAPRAQRIDCAPVEHETRRRRLECHPLRGERRPHIPQRERGVEMLLLHRLAVQREAAPDMRRVAVEMQFDEPRMIEYALDRRCQRTEPKLIAAPLHGRRGEHVERRPEIARAEYDGTKTRDV